MSDAITLDVLSSSPVQLDVGDADPIAREEIAALATRVTTVEGDVTALDGRMDAAEGDISTLGTTVDGIDARVEAIEADYVTSEDVMDALGGEAPTLVAGSATGILGDTETASWTERTTAADGAALIEAIYGNTVVQDGSLLPVRMEGVETVGFNQWDEEWELGAITANGNYPSTTNIRSANYIPCVGGATYFSKCSTQIVVFQYDENKTLIRPSSSPHTIVNANSEFTTLSNAKYMRFYTQPDYGTTYKGDICINLSDPSRNGTYEPYWRSERTIPAATYFPDGMRSAGTVRDELRADAAVTRIDEVVLDGSQSRLRYVVNLASGASQNMTVVVIPQSTWVAAGLPAPTNQMPTVKCDKLPTMSTVYNSWTGKGISGWSDTTAALILAPTGDNSITTDTEFVAWLRQNPLTIHYALATPTTTPIDPPLPLSYRTGAGGIERVMVVSGTTSAPPVFATRYPLDPADLAVSIAPRESATAEANHAVGDLVMLGWTLCRVTTAIARGEAITIGTNVTKTSVAAEIAALS